MIICPFCDAQNIEGADQCEECGQSLADQHLPTPATHVEQCLLRDRVGVLSPKTPITVAPSDTVKEVLDKLVQHGIGCALVVDADGKLAGIFSERDALIKLGDRARDEGQRPISDFMTPKVQTLDDTAKVAFAVHRMELGAFRHIPIVDGDSSRAVGVISVRDILKYLTDKLAEGGE